MSEIAKLLKHIDKLNPRNYNLPYIRDFLTKIKKVEDKMQVVGMWLGFRDTRKNDRFHDGMVGLNQEHYEFFADHGIDYRKLLLEYNDELNAISEQDVDVQKDMEKDVKKYIEGYVSELNDKLKKYDANMADYGVKLSEYDVKLVEKLKDYDTKLKDYDTKLSSVSSRLDNIYENLLNIMQNMQTNKQTTNEEMPQSAKKKIVKVQN